jgi:hypothetical protein
MCTITRNCLSRRCHAVPRLHSWPTILTHFLCHPVRALISAATNAPGPSVRETASASKCVARLSGPFCAPALDACVPSPATACRVAATRSLACTLVSHHSNTFPLPPRPRAHQCGRYCSGDSCATGCNINFVRCTPHGPTRAAALGACVPSPATACRVAATRSLACTRGPPY